MYQLTAIITHTSIAAGVGMAISRVCLFVRALKEKRLELSTPNLVHTYSIVVARHALTQMSKGRRSRSHGYKNRIVAWLPVTMVSIAQPCATCSRCRRGSACQYNCLCFRVSNDFEWKL